MRIVIATGNEGKVKEFRSLLNDLEIPIFSLKDLNLSPDIKEDGKTLSENARIKANALGILSDTIVLGDDSGFFIDAKDGAPGIFSARYLDSFPSREDCFRSILSELSGKCGDERACHFETHIAMLFPDGTEETVVGELHGLVSEEISGNHGFGYDPIFYDPISKRTTADMTSEEKNQISHRSRAIKKARVFIEDYLKKTADASKM